MFYQPNIVLASCCVDQQTLFLLKYCAGQMLFQPNVVSAKCCFSQMLFKPNLASVEHCGKEMCQAEGITKCSVRNILLANCFSGHKLCQKRQIL